MEIFEERDNLIINDIKCYNIALTLDCGQAFRWRATDDGCFEGVALGEYLKLKQENDKIILFNTTRESYENKWKNYFDFEKDYEKICEKLKEDEFIKSAVEEYEGIRILNQDSYEALISFVISQQNNIKRIKLIIERLCKAYGEKIQGEWYTFPSCEKLSQLTVEDFENLGLGYRAKYLEKLTKDLYNGEIDLEKIKSLDLDSAKRELKNIYGVGEKVASCVLLFGMGFYSAFPVDVWMKRVMLNYPNGLPKCFDGIEGIAQQYLFHAIRTKEN